MRGKVGLVVGLAAGYVLGARAGRERYEQIKAQALKVWELEPVQKQVVRLQELGKSAVMALPNAVWNGAVKVTKAATTKGTPGQRLDAALDAGKKAAGDVADAAETSVEAAEDAVEKAVKKVASARSETEGAAAADSPADSGSSTGQPAGDSSSGK